MIAVLLIHALAVALAPVALRYVGRNALLMLATAPLAGVVWALAHTSSVFSGDILAEEYSWVPALSLDVAFRLDPLSWLMVLVVSGVGALVMVYAARYFSENAASLGRFSAVFTAFAGAMFGLVTADHLMMVYLFWEMTTILSFLLIGHHFDRRAARAAARQAIHVTGAGSLAMFAGFVMVAHPTGGSYRISVLVAAIQAGSYDGHSPLVIVGAILIIWGAAAKSALVPHHFWLPGAMAAPTPVSAYLHAAAMVKAGVYLIARLTPAFTYVPGWSPLIVIIGLATMVLGGYRALRQIDLKLVLAYGTVSQLGLISAALGFGTSATMAAGLGMLIAHSVFKSALFMSVGLVEKTTGTRDLRELSNLMRYKPWLAAAGGICAISMAGVPLLLGYLGKEAFVTALVDGTHAVWLLELMPASNLGMRAVELGCLAVLVGGSMFTVAYSWRYWWGAFAPKRVKVDMKVEPTPAVSIAPIVLLAAASLAGAYPAWMDAVTNLIATGMPGDSHIALWSGVVPAVCTGAILIGGAYMAVKRPAVARLQRRLQPKHVNVVSAYRWSVIALENFSARITAILHPGSLPWDVNTILAVFAVIVVYALAHISDPTVKLSLWNSPLEVGIAVVCAAAAVVAVQARRRIKSVIALGVVGSTMVLLFVIYGAPDLALTQSVVEIVSFIVFALVLRSLPRFFSNRPLQISRWLRLALACTVGAAVSVATIFAVQARVHEPSSDLMKKEALPFGYGTNIVNVTLVDIRAWDTIGELSVVLVTATGVASLIYLSRRHTRIERAPRVSVGSWLPSTARLSPLQRSVMLEIGVRLMFPTLIVVSIWLTLVGHNNPGGGFAGGVVAGIALVLRYLAGGRAELWSALPIAPGRMLGLGLFIAAIGALMPLAQGKRVLESTPIDIPLGFVGQLHFTTALVVDIGVYVLVFALVLDLLASLGAQIDRDREQSQAQRQKPSQSQEKDVKL